MRFKVGDKVVVREWDEMAREFGTDNAGDIDTPKYCFVKEMKHLCGQTLTIESISCDHYRAVGKWLIFTDEMLMPFEFHKSDMNNGDMLKVRSGEIYMWLNGKPIYLHNYLSYTRDDLKNAENTNYDVMEVRDSKNYEGNISDLFDEYESLPVRWVRKEEPTVKEFTMDEINKILKEKFPDVDEFKINTKE